VELQLCHSSEIKNTIDNAWGVVHNKNKKAQSAHDARGTAKTQADLQLIPIGQDINRKRYWVTDGPCTFVLRLDFPICVYLPENYFESFLPLSGPGLPLKTSIGDGIMTKMLPYCRFSPCLCIHKPMEDYRDVSDHLNNARGIRETHR
jgi:hypothetical protein